MTFMTFVIFIRHHISRLSDYGFAPGLSEQAGRHDAGSTTL
jgi:hypothetical protein